MTASSSDPNRLPAHQSQQTIADGSTRLAYDRAGTGEPLILLHGQGFLAAAGSRSPQPSPPTAT